MATSTTTKLTATAGVYRNENNNGGSTLYLGSATTSDTTPGTYKSFITFSKPSLPAGSKITKFELSIRVRVSSSGYNGCVASVGFVDSASWSAAEKGIFSTTFNITETNAWHTYTTTNTSDLNILKKIINDSSSNMIIRLQRVSGQGIYGYLYNSSSYYPYINITYQKGTAVYVYTSGAWHEATPYVAVTPSSNPSYTYPSSGTCTVSASSTYSSTYAASKAMDGSNTSAPWASSTSDSSPYIIIGLPKPLYNITVTIQNRGDRTDEANGIISGVIYGGKSSSSWTSLKTISGRDGETISSSTTYSLYNSSTSYSYIKISASSWDTSNGNYVAIGEITITGKQYKSGANWFEASSYVYNSGWV